METVAYYDGKRIEDLTKEEMTECIKYLANEVDGLYKQNKRDRDFWYYIGQIQNNNITKLNNKIWESLNGLFGVEK